MLIETLELAWTDRYDFYVGGNMFVYFSPDQVRAYDFRGPDFFVVLDVPRKERKSWVTWEEGKGPDVVIELVSASTAEQDKHQKKLIYQNRLRVPDYFWYDPFSGDWAGFTLQAGKYVPLNPDTENRLVSQQLDLALIRWDGLYQGIEARWLRWMTLDGALLLTSQEVADREQQRAEDLATLLARDQEKFGSLLE